jgi:hypothetical protein
MPIFSFTVANTYHLAGNVFSGFTGSKLTMLTRKIRYRETFVSPLTLPEMVSGGIDNLIVHTSVFGGRRHEAERFWEKGEGRMCMQCCGHDHFGSCTETAKCYICAGEHEGAKQECAA